MQPQYELPLAHFRSIQGGSGAGSGGVEVGGKLTNALINGTLAGGDSTATKSLVKSGFINAHRIQSVTINGNLTAGMDGGAGLASSGVIRSETTIGKVRIFGNIVGNEDVAAIVSAPGDTSGPAIRTLIVGGNATFAEILGGYGPNATVLSPRGNESNSDAQIGTINIQGNLRYSSIVAGVSAGSDGLFGTTDDLAIGGANTTNAARTVSKIARIIIGGQVLAGTGSAGIEAQFVQSVTVGRSVFSLASGPGNDGAPGRELAAGSGIRLFEVPVV